MNKGVTNNLPPASGSLFDGCKASGIVDAMDTPSAKKHTAYSTDNANDKGKKYHRRRPIACIRHRSALPFQQPPPDCRSTTKDHKENMEEAKHPRHSPQQGAHLIRSTKKWRTKDPIEPSPINEHIGAGNYLGERKPNLTSCSLQKTPSSTSSTESTKRSKSLLWPSPEMASILPPPLEKRRRDRTLDNDPSADTSTYKLADQHLQLYTSHPPWSRAPLPSPSPKETPEGRGPADRHREIKIASESPFFTVERGKEIERLPYPNKIGLKNRTFCLIGHQSHYKIRLYLYY